MTSLEPPELVVKRLFLKQCKAKNISFLEVWNIFSLGSVANNDTDDDDDNDGNDDDDDNDGNDDDDDNDVKIVSTRVLLILTKN